MKMNEYRDERCCYFHPREIIVGVCVFCLNERLLVLASKQGHVGNHNIHKNHSVKKIFDLTTFLNRLDVKQQRGSERECNNYSSSVSQEDSFISFKFEDNGVASLDKKKIPNVPLNQPSTKMSLNNNWNKDKKVNSMVEQTKPRAMLRWQRRIGRLFRLIRWKRSSKKGNMWHEGTKVEGAKIIRYGWIKSITKWRTKE